MTAHNIVILGAGVIGLTIAHVLLDKFKDKNLKITIVAREFPSDLASQAWASPWAGADWSPIGNYEERKYRMESKTFNRLWDLIPTGLVKAFPSVICYPEEISENDVWYKDLVRDFRHLSKEELPSGSVAGVHFTTVSLTPELYLEWLSDQLAIRGVNFVRKEVDSIQDIISIAGPDGVVVHCTGLGARTLGGVEDPDVYPIRGQTTLVYAPGVKGAFAYPLGVGTVTNGEAAYLIPRPQPEGHVLIGGTFQEHSWDLSVNEQTSKDIWKRCEAIVPALNDPEVKVLRHAVGLRPAREGGPRIESQWYNSPSNDNNKYPVIHAYGFGPAGYQSSWGAAEEVADIFQNIISAST